MGTKKKSAYLSASTLAIFVALVISLVGICGLDIFLRIQPQNDNWKTFLGAGFACILLVGVWYFSDASKKIVRVILVYSSYKGSLLSFPVWRGHIDSFVEKIVNSLGIAGYPQTIHPHQPVRFTQSKWGQRCMSSDQVTLLNVLRIESASVDSKRPIPSGQYITKSDTREEGCGWYWMGLHRSVRSPNLSWHVD